MSRDPFPDDDVSKLDTRITTDAKDAILAISVQTHQPMNVLIDTAIRLLALDYTSKRDQRFSGLRTYLAGGNPDLKKKIGEAIDTLIDETDW